MKHRAGARVALCRNDAIVVVDDLLYNGQSDARSGKRRSGMKSLERLEDLVAVLVRKTDAVIGDGNMVVLVVALLLVTRNIRSLDQLGADHDIRRLLRLRKLYRVRQQV